jgi:hypothetical protein
MHDKLLENIYNTQIPPKPTQMHYATRTLNNSQILLYTTQMLSNTRYNTQILPYFPNAQCTSRIHRNHTNTQQCNSNTLTVKTRILHILPARMHATLPIRTSVEHV